MRILLDTCLSNEVRDRLLARGDDVVWGGDWPVDPADDEMLSMALEQDRVLVTLDKDFGELVVLHRRPHRGVVRLVGFRAREQADVCCAALERYQRELSEGALVTVEPG